LTKFKGIHHRGHEGSQRKLKARVTGSSIGARMGNLVNLSVLCG
jgi:hypothetical protein